MSRKDFDLSELDDFFTSMIDIADKQMPKETRKFLMSEGNKLRKLTLNKAKQLVKVNRGEYLKGIKRGKVYDFNGDKAIRIYGASPHHHLVEYGHRQVTEDGREVGFVKGKLVYSKAADEFEQQYINDVEEWIADMIKKGLG